MEPNEYYHKLQSEIEEVCKDQAKLEKSSDKLDHKVHLIITEIKKDKKELQKLARALPDSISRFYVFQAIEEI